MKQPVFVLCPPNLNRAQEAARKRVINEVNRQRLQIKTLVPYDNSNTSLNEERKREIRSCEGGIILCFRQLLVLGTDENKDNKRINLNIKEVFSILTPWDYIIIGMCLAEGTPLIVFKEAEIPGGKYEICGSILYFHDMPIGKQTNEQVSSLRSVIDRWFNNILSNNPFHLMYE